MPGSRFQERIIPKIDTLDPQSMQSVIQHLARERGFLENIFNTVHEAVLVIDSTLRILYHNAAAKEMLGLPDELSRLKISKILKGINWDAMLPSPGENHNSTKLMRQELEIHYPAHRILQFYAVPMERKTSLYTLILNDITDTLKKAASTAETERSQMVSLLAAGVAHEIGNPLNSLYLHLQFFQRMLGSGELDREEALQEITEARREVERLDAIINKFLHALRPGKPDMRITDLKDLILESLKFMRHEIDSRNISVTLECAEDGTRIMGDAGQLKQAFYNLVKNALQSMRHGGHLGIACRTDDDFVSLSISDDGCGVRKEDLPRIFKPYFTTKGSGGTGLGLMIVDRIVREHGASLSVDSTEGKGTTFTISFPRHERTVRILPPPEEEAAPAPRSALPSGNGSMRGKEAAEKPAGMPQETPGNTPGKQGETFMGEERK